MGGYYFIVSSYLEKYEKFRKNSRFSRRIWPDRGKTAWADMAGLGSKGLIDFALCFIPSFIYHEPHIYIEKTVFIK